MITLHTYFFFNYFDIMMKFFKFIVTSSIDYKQDKLNINIIKIHNTPSITIDNSL